MQEQTFCMVKPDGVSRGLVQEIEKRIMGSRLEIIKSKLIHLTVDEAEKLYAMHKEKSFYGGLVKSITSGPVFLMKLQGENAIHKLRGLMGATNPQNAEAGTIRGDFKDEPVFDEFGIYRNIVHGSDSKENAEHELGLFF